MHIMCYVLRGRSRIILVLYSDLNEEIMLSQINLFAFRQVVPSLVRRQELLCHHLFGGFGDFAWYVRALPKMGDHFDLQNLRE